MRKIHLLPLDLISKIAAGEVIERPSFAVKELIENSLDAKATAIHILIEEAGLKKIQVTDNGEGMSEEDVQESWKPHTTSKILKEEELHTIRSFGFRGEALSSLAAVSQLVIQSRMNSRQTGFLVAVSEGKLQHESVIGMPVGTIITVENLFAHIPARKKFLKSPQTELRQIISVVTNLALMYPSVQFILQHGKKILLHCWPTSEISERVEQLIGADIYSFLIPVKKEESYISINGFVAKPQISRSSQNKQYLFINKRKINDKLIATAIKEAYGTMLEATAYPIFILNVSLPFEMVDVNIHPRKEQVNFLNNQFIFQTIRMLVGEVLSENNITFENISWKKREIGITQSFAGKLLTESVLEKETFFEVSTHLLQLHRLYIIAPTKNGLLMVDQHAAHERILFEKFLKEFLSLKEKQKSYQLQKPVTLSLSPEEKFLLKENKPILKKWGFDFSQNSITHIPYLFQDRNPRELVFELLESKEKKNGISSLDQLSKKMIAFLACRDAVKAGDELSEEQMKKILTELETTSHNVTCPHGRPTRIFIEKKELNSLFKRK